MPLGLAPMDPYVGGRRVRAPSQTKERRKCLCRQREPYSMEKRPSFGLWLRIYHLPPAGKRMFPLTVIDARDGEDTDAVLAILVPVFSILLAQIRIRSFWDLNNALIGFIYALETSAAFQVMIKWLIGGLRPSFYDICQPDPTLVNNPDFNGTGPNGAGYRQYMFTAEICTVEQGWDLWNAMQSFPSGHSTTTSAAAVYLSLYLNAKLKVFANYHPSMWKLILFYCPILGATLVCGCLTIDESHNWYDILAGITIGTTFAFSAYRMVYASVWDWRINHIPLNRGSEFIWSDGCEGSDLVFTNRAGWRKGRVDSEKGVLSSPGIRNENLEGDSAGDPNGNTSGSHAGSHSSRPPQYPIRRSRDRDRGADMV
ncbi:acid phosphatase/Vanadium-dependent haloperoxidase [Hypoxylon trugodes]|uniref:acid phosphatase/Vanadium-dependent haloperoxidase n=1 Tax=Hypoxylon trugodes TaxID=326681 RepID=UPI00219A0729|nr:acid phosphatase/Vanadium-dependent haloperoxidase [Hypoxylon trugodes]KAI1388378.1 acid phosphatase/Vanadium-dependent haloperoxidase [Hypoxylon trugodes]